MSLDTATELIRQTLVLALIVSAPMLVIGVVVGVIVSLLQAITQIQEQSLSFVPKIVAMVASAGVSVRLCCSSLSSKSRRRFLRGRSSSSSSRS